MSFITKSAIVDNSTSTSTSTSTKKSIQIEEKKIKEFFGRLRKGGSNAKESIHNLLNQNACFFDNYIFQKKFLKNLLDCSIKDREIIQMITERIEFTHFKVDHHLDEKWSIKFDKMIRDLQKKPEAIGAINFLSGNLTSFEQQNIAEGLIDAEINNNDLFVFSLLNCLKKFTEKNAQKIIIKILIAKASPVSLIHPNFISLLDNFELEDFFEVEQKVIKNIQKSWEQRQKVFSEVHAVLIA